MVFFSVVSLGAWVDYRIGLSFLRVDGWQSWEFDMNGLRCGLGLGMIETGLDVIVMMHADLGS